MNYSFEKLKNLLEHIKTIGFFSRIFRWKKVRELLVDAVGDFQRLLTNTEYLNQNITELKNLNDQLHNELEIAKTSVINLTNEFNNLKSSYQVQSTKVNSLTADNASKNTTIKSQQERLNELQNDLKSIKQENQQLADKNTENSEEIARTKQSLNDYIQRNNELNLEVERLKGELKTIQSERDQLNNTNARLLTEEDNRKKEFEEKIATLDSIQKRIEEERKKEKEEAQQKEMQRLEKLKDTWKNHQDAVKNTIKNICQRHTIAYVDKVPFKGDPDNTIEISGEYIIFDAKSPKTDDLNNFPYYLQQQAEAAKKYAKQDNVKRWIFFVVPSNTYEVIKKSVYNLADYDVFIVTLDSIEPIILSLKKIEEYDFAEQLSPEERENICRVLGKFAHLSKRRIQVDYYFIRQFIELAYNAETDLPRDILEEVKKFEKEGKINPPQERRAKAITTRELDEESLKIQNDAINQGILIKEETLREQINQLPLYNNSNDAEGLK